MGEEYEVVEIELSNEEMDSWIEKLKRVKEGEEHEHLKYKKGVILVTQKINKH